MKKLNEYANDPAAAAAAIAAAAPAPAAAPAIPGFPGLTPEQWAQMMGLPAPAAAAAVAPAAVPGASSSGAAPAAAAAATGAAASNPAIAQLDLSSLLGLLGPGAAGAAAAAPAASAGGLTATDLQRAMAAAAGPGRERPVPLQEIVTSEAVMNRCAHTFVCACACTCACMCTPHRPLLPPPAHCSGVLSEPSVRASLVEHLPDGQRSEAFLEDTIRSPQVGAALYCIALFCTVRYCTVRPGIVG